MGQVIIKFSTDNAAFKEEAGGLVNVAEQIVIWCRGHEQYPVSASHTLHDRNGNGIGIIVFEEEDDNEGDAGEGIAVSTTASASALSCPAS